MSLLYLFFFLTARLCHVPTAMYVLGTRSYLQDLGIQDSSIPLVTHAKSPERKSFL